MAVCPFAVKRLIAPGDNDPRITPRVAILHVDAGNAYDLHDYFAYRSGGIESHFHVAKDGTIFQYRDTDYEADANYKANPFAVSIETQGLGHEEWTAKQLQSIKALLLWLKRTHNIPLQKCPAWDGSGVGYHIQFGSPGYWTNVVKGCPGPKRIAQFENVLVQWMVRQNGLGRNLRGALRDLRKARAYWRKRKDRPAGVRRVQRAIDWVNRMRGL